MTGSAVGNFDAADVIAYVDEAGAKGLSRNLSEARDHEIGLFCALAFPADRLEEFRGAFLPGYNRFISAMPDGAKAHITDAFRAGHEAWGAVAKEVREEFFAAIDRLQVPVIYEARRLAVERTGFGDVQQLVQQAKEARQSSVRVSDRPSDQRVEDWLMTGLTLKLDAFMEDAGLNKLDIYFDEIDDILAGRYGDRIAEACSVSHSERIVKGWDLAASAPVYGKIECSVRASFDVNVTHVGSINVIGKGDPLVLATDIVANSLYNHLSNLASDEFLNRPSSIQGWILEGRVYGVRPDAIEDII